MLSKVRYAYGTFLTLKTIVTFPTNCTQHAFSESHHGCMISKGQPSRDLMTNH